MAWPEDGKSSLDGRDNGKRGSGSAGDGEKGKARRSPGLSLRLGAAVEGRSGQPWCVTRDAVKSSSPCKAQGSQQIKATFWWGSHNCCHIPRWQQGTQHIWPWQQLHQLVPAQFFIQLNVLVLYIRGVPQYGCSYAWRPALWKDLGI